MYTYLEEGGGETFKKRWKREINGSNFGVTPNDIRLHWTSTPFSGTLSGMKCLVSFDFRRFFFLFRVNNLKCFDSFHRCRVDVSVLSDMDTFI